MKDNSFYLKSLPPHEVVGKLLKTIEHLNPESQIDALNVSTNFGHTDILQGVGGISAKSLPQNETFRNRVKLLEDHSFLDARSVSINVTGTFTITYNESKEEGPHIVLKMAGHDQNNLSSKTHVIDALHKNFTFVRHSELMSSVIPESQKNLFEYVERTIGTFAVEAAKLSQLSASNVQKLSELIVEKTNDLEKHYQTKSQDLESKYELKSHELDDSMRKHKEAVARFDLRENTAVRRELFNKIQTIVSEQKDVKITESTLQKRLPVHIVCGILGLFGLLSVIFFGIKLYQSSSFDWHFLLPMTSGTIIFLSTSIFYVRWTDGWFKEHSRAEFSNRKFSSDIIRASWIAEMFFEWDSKKQTQFPPELIASYTTGLFIDDQAVDPAKHPIDDTVELMKRFSTVKLGKAGLELSKSKK
jgi:hypothetical protein